MHKETQCLYHLKQCEITSPLPTATRQAFVVCLETSSVAVGVPWDELRMCGHWIQSSTILMRDQLITWRYHLFLLLLSPSFHSTEYYNIMIRSVPQNHVSSQLNLVQDQLLCQYPFWNSETIWNICCFKFQLEEESWWRKANINVKDIFVLLMCVVSHNS
jgi:hypothetical protein